MLRTIKQLAILLALGLSAGLFVQAQLIPDFTPVALIATPPSPSPDESITVEATTPTFDKNTAFFSWTVNGQLRQDFSGRGKDTIQLRAGGVGSAITVSVIVSRDGGFDGSSSLTIRVSDLALTWFAETLAPKWYKGKALPSPDSVVNIVAVPDVIIDGARIRPENLIYKWDLDDQTKVLTGVGEQVLRVRISDIRGVTHRIRVVVENATREFKREERISIRSQEPKAVLYSASPLGGTEYITTPSIPQTAKIGPLDFIAELFFLPIQSKNELSYEWKVGNATIIATENAPYLLTVDTAGQQSGTLPVSVAISDKNPSTPSLTKTISLLIP